MVKKFVLFRLFRNLVLPLHTMKSKALYLSWVVWLVAVGAMAQSRPRYGLQRVHTADVQTGMVHAYTDSLNMLRDRIYGQGGVYGAEASADSALLAGVRVQPDVLTAPLLLPPTFYRHAADGMFVIPSARQTAPSIGIGWAESG